MKVPDIGDFDAVPVIELFVKVGDTIFVKKPHPCGSREFLVLRVGMDFRIRCTGCGHRG